MHLCSRYLILNQKTFIEPIFFLKPYILLKQHDQNGYYCDFSRLQCENIDMFDICLVFWYKIYQSGNYYTDICNVYTPNSERILLPYFDTFYQIQFIREHIYGNLNNFCLQPVLGAQKVDEQG